MTVIFNHFPIIAAKLRPALAQVVSETATELQTNVQGHIRANGQVRTGNMLNSVHVENGPDELTKLVIAGAPYSIYQEMGTRYIPARPFFYPGVQDTKPFFEEALSRIEDKLK